MRSTPNTSLTFGRPNPTTSHLRRTNSTCGSSKVASHRNRRYSLAEQALASALESSSEERSPLELQIWALQRASTALSTRAQESRERASKLKLRLADRDTDPDTYVSLQQERWMEEKRQLAIDREVKVLTQQIAVLKADRKRGQEEENLGLPPTLNNEARRRANLDLFFNQSPTRTSFHLNLKCRLTLDHSFPRRITMSDVSPLRLRPSSVTPPLRRFTTKHARPTSMGGELFNPVKRPCKPRLGNSTSDASSLTKVAENSAKAQSVSDRSSHHSSQRMSCRLVANSITNGSDDLASTRPSTPPLSIASEVMSQPARALKSSRI
ncbi:hypothetical protein HYDPIDRAFT_29984 [Hydnomerulius pinastri MD-312]|uniref:Unplaced genomic scaffold scaffold_19, whole genome shotgun sequence n=1 Tax=Hydnomerulius pinastri MD-312 TaxID=994086 RepID=A0A0C9VAZ7_9AGAM|nr:hypothetical protein HYDPIDRAFT_29984 [Hydnomerulius pinastri MD-312]